MSDLEERVAALERALETFSGPAVRPAANEEAEPDFWVLDELRRRHPAGAIVFAGTAAVGKGEVAWQWGALSDDLRKVAEDELESIRNGGAVDPSYQRVKAAQRVAELMKPDDKSEMDRIADEVLANAKADRARRIKENRAKREAAAANIKRSTRSFALKWAELDGWSRKYDAEQIAREIKPDDWALFLRVLDETQAFVKAVNLARNSRAPQS